MKTNIKVYCRVKPSTNNNEISNPEFFKSMSNCLKIVTKTRLEFANQFPTAHVQKNLQNFSFDLIFPEEANQEEIFEETTRPLVQKLLEGFNATILAYGQTNSGKTYTLFGENNLQESPNFLSGIAPRAIYKIFEAINLHSEKNEFKIWVAFFEIYNEKINDLLAQNTIKIKIREQNDEIFLENLTEQRVENSNQVLKLLDQSLKNRTSSSTKMNQNSSRSHYIFQLILEKRQKENSKACRSKLFIVDLAGSEKLNKTKAEGQSLEEAKSINKSLSELGNVIFALSAKSREKRKTEKENNEAKSQVSFHDSSFRTYYSLANSYSENGSNSIPIQKIQGTSVNFDKVQIIDKNEKKDNPLNFRSLNFEISNKLFTNKQ